MNAWRQNEKAVIDGKLFAIADMTGRHGEVHFARLVRSAHTVVDLFPHLRYLDFNRAWAGVKAFTDDSLPAISASRRASNPNYSFGYCRSGFQHGPEYGWLVSEHVRRPYFKSRQECRLPGTRRTDSGVPESGAGLLPWDFDGKTLFRSRVEDARIDCLRGETEIRSGRLSGNAASGYDRT
jgi:glycine/D-amino acid oxidase-like deaminating enzyme